MINKVARHTGSKLCTKVATQCFCAAADCTSDLASLLPSAEQVFHCSLRCCAGNGGFFIISANQTIFQADFFVLGSLFSQCTVTMYADKSNEPTFSPNCALGQSNACCNADGGNSCYKK